mgnify:FL=1
MLMFGFLLLNGATTDGTTIKPKGGCATTTATKGPSTAKVVCIKEEDRNIFQKYWCRYMAQIGRMCKLEYDCLKVKKNKTDEENKRLEDEAKIQALCEDMSYKHVASKNGFLLEAAKTGSKQIGKIKKGEKISVMARVEGKADWMLIATKTCSQGYINEKYVKLIDVEPPPPPPPPTNKAFIITSPKWVKKNELMKVPSSGFFDIVGTVNKSFDIDQITLNGENLIIESDKSFSETLLIKNEDLDIRIIAYKNKEQVGKPLIFKIKVSN